MKNTSGKSHAGKRTVAIALAAAVAVSLVSGFNLENNIVSAGAVTSLPNIEQIKSKINNGDTFNILEVTPDNKTTETEESNNTPEQDAAIAQGKGQFGYLISGQEPVNLNDSLKNMVGAGTDTEYKSGNERRSAYANKVLEGLADAGIASTEDDKAPIRVKTVAGNKGETYYHELYPWDSDVDGEKTYTLNGVYDTVTLKNASYEQKEGGAYSPVSSSYVSASNGNYVQRIDSAENPYEAIEAVFADDSKLQELKSGYVFYKLYITQKDPDQIKSGDLVFSRKKDSSDSWTYDYLATERQLFSSNSDYAVGGDYAQAPKLGSEISNDETLDELKKQEPVTDDAGNIKIAFWCVSQILTERPFERVADGTGYFNMTNAKFTYVGAGKGEYTITGANKDNIVKPGESTSDSDISIQYNIIRYTGGYTNNNWFLTKVLDYDTSDVNDDLNKNVNVDYVTVSRVTTDKNETAGQSQNFADYDLVVLAGGFDYSKNEDENYGYQNDGYDKVKATDNLTTSLKDYLQKEMPVLADSSAVSDKAFGGYDGNPLINKSGEKTPGINKEGYAGKYGAVQNSVYIFKRNSADNKNDYLTMVSSTFRAEFTPSEDNYSKDGTPFFDVYDDIAYENSLRRKNDSSAELLNDKISEAEAIRYIINFNGKRLRVRKNTIRILDLEPENVKVVKNTNGTTTDLTTDDAKQTFFTNTIQPMLTAAGYSDLTLSESEAKNNSSKVLVTITTMTTNTLNGLADNISETYDMVYIGHRTGVKKFYTPEMEGLVYYNIGGVYYNRNDALYALNGYLDQDYDTDQTATTWNSYRYPGNDLQQKKYKELNTFIKQGKTVVVADDLLTYDETKNEYSVSKKTVDANTRLYDVLQDNIDRGCKNIMNEDSAKKGNAELTNSLGVSAPHLNFPDGESSDLPPAYNQSNPYSSVIGGSAAYDGNVRKPGTKNLDYTFQIINEVELDPENTTYQVKVYADTNNDGVFKPEEWIRDAVVKKDGSAVPYDAVTGNIDSEKAPTITISAPLPESFQGAITWKLEVTRVAKTGENQDDMTMCTQKGISFVGLDNRDGRHKIKIRVLQIVAKPSKSSPGYPWDNMNWQGSHGIAISSSGTPKIWYYLKNNYRLANVLNDYDITVTAKRGTDEAYSLMHDNTSWQNDYDIVLMGLSDAYGHLVTDEKNAVTGSRYKTEYVYKQIADFIDNGHSVLFGHDNSMWCSINTNNTAGGRIYNYRPSTKSQYNDDKWGANWQTGFTDMIKILRTKAHQDLYGISDVSSSHDITFNGQSEHIGGTKYWDTDNGTDRNKIVDPVKESGALAKHPTSLFTEEIKAIEAAGYNIAYTPISGGDKKQGTVEEVQGFSNPTAKRAWHNIEIGLDSDSNKYSGNIFNDASLVKGLDLINPYKNQTRFRNRGFIAFNGEPDISDGDNNRIVNMMNSTNVNQVGKGQITSYPYNLNKEEFKNGFTYKASSGTKRTIKVKATHGQWYTLNANDDDIQVWYTVEDTGKTGKWGGEGFYGHDDCVNDYLIYNCGNITYTGIGNSGIGSDGGNGDVYDDEAMLIVNTIIASYRPETTAPTAKFTDSKGESEMKNMSISTYTDPSSSSDSGSSTKDDDKKKQIEEKLSNSKIYFTVSDSNIAANKVVSAEFYKNATANESSDQSTGSFTVSDSDRISQVSKDQSGLKIYDAKTNEVVDPKKTLDSNTVYYIKVSDTSLATELSAGTSPVSIYMRPVVSIGSNKTYGQVIQLSISLSEGTLFNLG